MGAIFKNTKYKHSIYIKKRQRHLLISCTSFRINELLPRGLNRFQWANLSKASVSSKSHETQRNGINYGKTIKLWQDDWSSDLKGEL